jgi:NAD-dependent histone deacetylase SIR2
MRSAHCLSCKDYVDVELFIQAVAKGEVLYCPKCKDGLVKPDVVFFGESLPRAFSSSLEEIDKADLVFIMGTSLKVSPFNLIVDIIPKNCPVVLINRENPGVYRQKFLFIEGDIDNSLQIIMESCGWNEDLIKIRNEVSSKL